MSDFDEVRDITVIGAGPVGMSTAFWAGMREASSRIIDSLPELGGQLTTLYPEKWIFDVPGHPKVLAKDLVEMLRVQSIEQFDVPVHLDTTAATISWEDDGEDRVVVLHTDKGELRSRTVIVAGGHGAFEPKKLPGYDITPWEGRGAHYIVGEKSVFEGKRVMIVGGGDSACDWVVNLLDTAADIHLVHRREGFRAHEVTVGQIMEAADRGDVMLHVPFQIREVYGDGGIERVRLFNSEDEAHELEVEVDAVLLQLGFKTALGPVEGLGLRGRQGRDRGRSGDEDVPGSRVGLRRHHDLRGQAQADRHRLCRVGHRRRPGRARDPPGHQDPAQVLDQHRRTGRRCRPAVSGASSPLKAIDHLRESDPVMRELVEEVGADGLGDPRRGPS